MMRNDGIEPIVRECDIGFADGHCARRWNRESRPRSFVEVSFNYEYVVRCRSGVESPRK